jgi:hypothetical protein
VVDESLADKTGDEGYPGSTIAAAVLATVFFPLLSLIAALFLHGRETNPVKKSSLRTWAFASAGWMAAQLVLAVVLFAVATSGSGVDTSGPCQGGPAIGVAGDERPDGTTVFPCEFGGSVTLTLP